MAQHWYFKCFREFGIIGGVKLIYWRLRHKFGGSSLSRGGMLKVFHIKKYGMDVWIRPYDSDFELLLSMFCRSDDELEYDIDLPLNNEEIEYIVDGGANIGFFSMIYAAKYPKAKIIAIEPDSRNFELLKQNTSQFSNIKCIKAGLWSSSVGLKLIDRGTGSWGFMVKECKKGEKGDIDAVSMMALMQQNNFPRIDILKLDIEGSENELLSQDYAMWLSKVKIMFIETHDKIIPGTDALVTNVMKDNGFKELHQNGENRIFCRQ